MSSFRQLMMKAKSSPAIPNPPSNLIMTTAGESITLSGAGNYTYRKDNDGLAYCGFFLYNNYIAPMLVSESQSACEMTRDYQYACTVSSTTFSYKGKNWYYITGSAATGSPSSTQNNGRYWINSQQTVTGSDDAERYLNAAKLLLDYVYEFVGLPNVPSNLLLSVTKNDYIKIGSYYFRKVYDGVAFGGYYNIQSNGSNWQLPMLVAETPEACEMIRDSSYTVEVSDTPFSYAGKNWYYIKGASAINTNSNQNNNRYFINNGVYFTGDTDAEKALNAAKALIEYVYTFNKIDASLYTTYNFLISSGSQYIDTGISTTSGFRFVATVKRTATPNFGILCGSHELSAPYKRNFVGGNNSAVLLGVGDGDYGGSSGSFSMNYCDVDFSNIYGNVYAKVDGVTKSLTAHDTPSADYSARNLFLFANNNVANGASQYFTGYIGVAKIYDNNDVLLGEFVPVLDKTSNKYGMYNTRTKQFCDNLGTGNFTVG